MGRVDSLSPELERLAFRPRIVEEIARQYQGSHLVVIEAQAGQGKTTAALQYLAQSDIAPVWYSLRPSDQDPLALLAGLYDACIRAVPGFRLPLLEELLEQGTIAPADHARIVTMLCLALQSTERQQRYLVIDDIHELEDRGTSATILGYLTAGAEAGLRLLLLSRRPILPGLGIAEDASPAGRVDNATLAFTTAETAELCGGTFQVSVARADLHRLSRLTEGWAMGLTLLASSLAKDGRIDTIPHEPLAVLRGGRIPDYFRTQLIDRLPEAERAALFALALLDTIPTALAHRLAPDLDLAQLSRHNLFLRPIDSGADGYAFHHLFQESLRRLAEAVLTTEQREEILVAAARWHGDRGETDTALRYLLRSRAYADADALARQGGLELLARNRIVTVHELLHGLPDEIFADHPWLSYLYALSLLNTDPPAAYPYLERARARFGERDDGVGELLATAQLMFFHMTVDTRYQEIPPLLERAQILFQGRGDSLSVPMRVQCAQYIAFANTHTEQDPEEAREYSAYALRLAERNGLENATANAVIGRAYEGMFRGDWARVRRDVEYAYLFQGSPRVAAFTRFLLRFVQANFLYHLGDTLNYRHARERAEQTLSANLYVRTLCQPFLACYDADLALAAGRVGDAETILDTALEGDHAATAPHTRSQFLHYRACVAALHGDRTGVERDASEALRLRAEAGHPYHTHRNHLLIALAYSLAGDRGQAEPHLDAVLAYAERQGVESLVPLASFLRASLRFQDEETETALQALGEALQRMRQNGHLHFFGWEPGLMHRLLSLAVAHGVDPDYARRLAAERMDSAILDDGQMVPLLNVRTLGGLSLVVEGYGAVHTGDLTPTQRELLGLLVTAPQKSLTYGEVQVALWPDGSPGRVRARLDTTIARLRKTLAAAFGKLPVSHYLPVEKKQLRLANCRIDAREFADYARAGLAHVRRKEYWSAGNALRTAHERWRGEFLPGITAAAQSRDELTSLYSASIVAWTKALEIGGETEEAVVIASRAVRNYPTEEALVRRLYDLHTRIGDPLSARRAVRTYEAALANEGNTAEEIAEILEWFWHQASAETEAE